MKKHNPEFLRLVENVRNNISEITIDELLKLKHEHKPLTLVDVREDHEWQMGHIPGAVHLGKGIIERDIEAKVSNTNEMLVLYCGGGFRSVLAADNLRKMGYTNVHSLKGGWGEWQQRQT